MEIKDFKLNAKEDKRMKVKKYATDMMNIKDLKEIVQLHEIQHKEEEETRSIKESKSANEIEEKIELFVEVLDEIDKEELVIIKVMLRNGQKEYKELECICEETDCNLQSLDMQYAELVNDLKQEVALLKIKEKEKINIHKELDKA